MGSFLRRPGGRRTPPGGLGPEDSLFNISDATFYAYLRKYAKLAGLDGLKPHDLRHTAARLRRNNGASIEDVGALLGHASIATPPRIERHEMAMWDMETVQRFLEAATGSRYRDFYHLALFTGMRRPELAGLQWPNIDLVNGRLSVAKTVQWMTGEGLAIGRPKTAKSCRSIALSPDVVALLHEIRGRQIAEQVAVADAWQPTGYVFTQATGGPVDPNGISRDFAGLVKAAELPHVTLHGLKHAHAMMLEEGINPKIVSEQLGHSTIVMKMDVYSYVLSGMQEAAVLALDAKLGRK